jgi:hypothetical protein
VNKSGHGKYFAATSDEGPFCVGPCETIEIAIDEAKSEYADELAEGGQIVLGIGTDVYCEVRGDRIIDNMADDMDSDLYEDAMDGWCENMPPGSMDELSKALTATLHAWLDKYGERKCWSMVETLADSKQPTQSS